jgi:hypothetical protein
MSIIILLKAIFRNFAINGFQLRNKFKSKYFTRATNGLYTLIDDEGIFIFNDFQFKPLVFFILITQTLFAILYFVFPLLLAVNNILFLLIFVGFFYAYIHLFYRFNFLTNKHQHFFAEELLFFLYTLIVTYILFYFAFGVFTSMLSITEQYNLISPSLLIVGFFMVFSIYRLYYLFEILSKISTPLGEYNWLIPKLGREYLRERQKLLDSNIKNQFRSIVLESPNKVFEINDSMFKNVRRFFILPNDYSILKALGASISQGSASLKAKGNNAEGKYLKFDRDFYDNNRIDFYNYKISFSIKIFWFCFDKHLFIYDETCSLKDLGIENLTFFKLKRVENK